jgi:hypothetical protein
MRTVYFALLAGSLPSGLPAMAADMDWGKVDQALDAELNPVLKALRENGIEVAAAHNHMLDDQPRTFFVHSGPTMRPPNWRKACVLHSIIRTSSRAEPSCF